ncbi:hypothetical protein GCM10009661_75860 [Catellatospora chokoriensis]|uniref:Uncharacterized protein n=1 Tax=Catellatospora chokoriensis TaxID=310353 RepID=A0A8J3K7A1_9ACTN|nr:hypothetical protein Cch02nite_79000 [Catellatospora chokoriensis]
MRHDDHRGLVCVLAQYPGGIPGHEQCLQLGVGEACRAGGDCGVAQDGPPFVFASWACVVHRVQDREAASSA